MDIAFIGTGKMGFPMAANLLRAGHEVNIPERRRSTEILELEKAGAKLHPNAADCAKGCDAAILMLPSSLEVVEVVEGPQGIGHALHEGAIVIDCTTSEPASTRKISTQLEALGIMMIDAPVVRGVKGAEAGTLAFFIGGNDEAVSQALPILEIMGDTLIRVGNIGTGHTTKILNNLLSLGHLSLLAEALELAERNGVELESFVEALMSGNARSATLEQHATRTMSKERENVLFRIALATKDLSLAAALSADLPISRSGSKHVFDLYAKAMEYELGEEDITTIREIFRKSDTVEYS